MEPFIPEKLPIQSIKWDSLIPLVGQANRAIANYDGILYGVPNPGILFSPLTTKEAVLSSQIEGTRATLGEVLKHEAGEEAQEETKKSDIREILNYRRALLEAVEELKTRPFNQNLILRLHGILLEGVRGKDKSRGRFRVGQNWIGPPGCPIEQARFVPPEAGRIAESLDNWEKYYHLDRPDPLVQLAVVHAQFEIIHPFADGNGRIGRMMVPLFLFEKKILSRPMFYISAYLEEHKDQYVESLRALIAPENWNQWIEFFLSALRDQAQANASKAREIIGLFERLKARVIDLTRSQYAVPLLDRLFDTPVFKSSDLKDLLGNPSRQMVFSLLSDLKRDGILKTVREGSGRRPQVLALAELVNLCEGREVI